MTNLEQLPPHNTHAEQAVLGSIIMDPPAIHDVLDVVTIGDFYHPTHAEIFRGLVALHEQRHGIDLLTVNNWLAEHGKLDHQMADLITLVNSTPTSVNARQYGMTVRENAMRRYIIANAAIMASTAYNADTPLNELLATVQGNLADATGKVNKGDLTGLQAGLATLYDKIQSDIDPNPITFPYTDLNYLLESLSTYKNEMVTIAARPGMGKTSALVDIALHAAYQKQHVALFSLEMSEEQLLTKMVSNKTKIESGHIRQKRLNDDQKQLIFKSMGQLSALPIYIDDTGDATVQSIAAKCHRLRMTVGLDLVIVDYLQLMESAKKSSNRTEEVGQISRGLKRLAMELNVPVIAAAQLSRAVEMRGDKRPLLADLRESGSIEQDSAAVIFIYRDDYYNPDTDRPNIAEFIVAKNRFGGTGVVDLYWSGQSTTFRNLMSGSKM